VTTPILGTLHFSVNDPSRHAAHWAELPVNDLDLVNERHGPLASIPLPATARIAAALAVEADLHPGAARTALRKAVQSARTGDPR
jgi:hypothetical protein